MKRGFTLIEGIIVIVILLVLVAVVVPTLIKAKIAKSEKNAASRLRTLNAMFAVFKKKGYACKGRRYPNAVPGGESSALPGMTNAGKFAGLYYEVNNAAAIVTLIGHADAAADFRADGNTDTKWNNGKYIPSTSFLGPPSRLWNTYLAPTFFSCGPIQGYWYGLCNGLTGTGGPYMYNMLESRNHYGLQAIPAIYGSSGESTLIINEEGTVYLRDRGDAGFMEWYPTVDPAVRGWEMAEW